MITKDQLQYLGAVRHPDGMNFDVDHTYPPTTSSWDHFGYSADPFHADFARREYVFGTRERRAARFKMVAPTLPQHLILPDRKLLNRSSIPAMPPVDGLAIDLSNDRWHELNVGDFREPQNAFEGVLPLGDKILVTGSIYYDASGSQDCSMLMADWPPTGRGPVTRTPWRTAKDIGEGWIAGPMCPIPERFRSLLKGDVIAGQSGLPIISRQSFGPCAIAFHANDLLTVQDIPTTLLIGYPGEHALAPWSGTAPNDLFNSSTVINGMCFVGDSLLFIGSHGYGPGCYGEGVADPNATGHEICYDPCGSSKGTHCYPYRIQTWVVPVSDLAAVVAGTKKPWEIIPQWFEIQVPFFDTSVYAPILPNTLPRIMPTGAAYDSERCELHMAVQGQDSAGYEPGPLVHVFKITGVPSFPNPLPTPRSGQPPIEPPPPVVDPPPVIDPDVDPLIEELQIQIIALTGQNDGLRTNLALRDAELADARTKLVAALGNDATIRAEVKAILTRNEGLKANSRLPVWCTAALNRIALLVK